MASDDGVLLPADLFHLVTAELAAKALQAESQEAARPEFAALYNCVLSSKYLASAGALSALYRISLHEKSPVKSGGSENNSFADQYLTVMKWSILWRTIILSALGKTLYPYCRHLRELDLRDLSNLIDRLDETRFRAKVTKQFFAGDLARFHFVGAPPGKGRAARLDSKKILLAVGDEITKHAPLLEGLSEPTSSDVLISALPAWTPRLAHLRSLQFWDGKLLADETIRNLLHAHCPRLHALQLYTCTNADSDHHLAAFIGGMQQNTLTSLENNNFCSIGPETCLALNHHGESLTELKLGLEEGGMLALALLKDCTALEDLKITALRQSVDLKATQHEVFVDIVEWLKHCTRLRSIAFDGMISAPDLLLPVLLNKDVTLASLEISAKEGSMYVVKDHRDFHRALGEQTSLKSLHLRADPDPISRDDMDILLDALCSLQNLRELNLYRISDYFSDQHIGQLARRLSRLENLYIGGYGISDSVLANIARLEYIKSVTFAGITSFTVDGLLEFVDQLPEGKSGLVVSVEAAEPESMISEERQDVVREALATKVDGRFEYQPIRDPNVPEFDESDSD
ncbi:hypothetical protein LTR36_008247 [Oleoguttula mirabilis]|uniref:RNI-like protein n=1 Tax=Oleoguttula mirabilis TaxID=1507867 RepID=A0AAV9J8R3_9PEZI|nr:hypothetical protein LTR36_008247 [Oleoguttula mirabilis]